MLTMVVCYYIAASNDDLERRDELPFISETGAYGPERFESGLQLVFFPVWTLNWTRYLYSFGFVSCGVMVVTSIFKMFNDVYPRQNITGGGEGVSLVGKGAGYITCVIIQVKKQFFFFAQHLLPLLVLWCRQWYLSRLVYILIFMHLLP